MTAEPRDVDELCGFAVIDDGEVRPCERPATGWRWYQECGHEDMLAMACDQHENEGGRRLAAADRENAELRGEVERLRESQFAIGQALVNEQLRSERAESQLAAAQAQLAEALSNDETRHKILETNREMRKAAEARLEAVRAVSARWEAERTYLSAEQEPIAAAYIELLTAALSAAPQPTCACAPKCDRLAGPTENSPYMDDYCLDCTLHRCDAEGSHIESTPRYGWEQPEPPASDEPTGRSD